MPRQYQTRRIPVALMLRQIEIAAVLVTSNQELGRQTAPLRVLHDGSILMNGMVGFEILQIIDQWISYIDDALEEADGYDKRLQKQVHWARKQEVRMVDRYIQYLEDNSDEEYYFAEEDEDLYSEQDFDLDLPYIDPKIASRVNPLMDFILPTSSERFMLLRFPPPPTFPIDSPPFPPLPNNQTVCMPKLNYLQQVTELIDLSTQMDNNQRRDIYQEAIRRRRKKTEDRASRKNRFDRE